MITADNWFLFASGGLVVVFIVGMCLLRWHVEYSMITPPVTFPERRCGNCRWYKGDDYTGRCQRHSPVFVRTGSDGIDVATWPPVLSTASCGDHEFRLKKQSENAT